MPVVKQRVRVLPGIVEADVLSCARRALSREDGAQFGAPSGDRQGYRVA
jgi:hypothetical protein